MNQTRSTNITTTESDASSAYSNEVKNLGYVGGLNYTQHIWSWRRKKTCTSKEKPTDTSPNRCEMVTGARCAYWKMLNFETRNSNEASSFYKAQRSSSPRRHRKQKVRQAESAFSLLSCRWFWKSRSTAFTGELRANGEWMEVGGVVAKVLACIGADVKTVYVPSENHEELKMMSAESQRSINIKGVKMVEQELHNIFSRVFWKFLLLKIALH